MVQIHITQHFISFHNLYFSLKGNFTRGPNPQFLFACSLEINCVIQTKKMHRKILIFDEVMDIQSWSFLSLRKNALSEFVTSSGISEAKIRYFREDMSEMVYQNRCILHKLFFLPF